MFGASLIESAPAFKVEKIDDEMYWLQATDSVFASVPEDRRAIIRKHFGEDAFMEGKEWRYSTGRAPSFDFSKTLYRSRPNMGVSSR